MILKPRKRRKPKIRGYTVKSESDEFIIRGNIIISEKAHYNSESPYNKMRFNMVGFEGGLTGTNYKINYHQFKNGERFKGRVKSTFLCKDSRESEEEQKGLEKKISFSRRLCLCFDPSRYGDSMYRFTRNKAFKTYSSEAKKLIQEVLNEESKRF